MKIYILYIYKIYKMQCLNYIGCKNTLFNSILKVCNDNIGDKLKEMHFLDIFAGTGIVGFNMQPKCKKISSNDLEYYSYVINYALLISNYSNKIQILIDDCNKLESIEGLIYKNFSPNSNCERMFFTPENAKKCDAIRVHINKLYEIESITQNEYYFLLASLLVSIDKFANTTSIYGAYLKKFKNSALKSLILKPIHNRIDNINNEVFNMLSEDLTQTENKWDVVYMDPPYNQRVYAANYSPLNYIAKYDSTIIINGKTGLISNYNKSNFSSKINVENAFKLIVENIKTLYIVLSYNNEGLLSYETIKNILLQKGNVKLYKIKYNKFKAKKDNKTPTYVEEYIWFVKCNDSFIQNKIKLNESTQDMDDFREIELNLFEEIRF
jgi:adenine-specific DNA-methyltransferase